MVEPLVYHTTLLLNDPKIFLTKNKFYLTRDHMHALHQRLVRVRVGREERVEVGGRLGGAVVHGGGGGAGVVLHVHVRLQGGVVTEAQAAQGDGLGDSLKKIFCASTTLYV